MSILAFRSGSALLRSPLLRHAAVPRRSVASSSEREWVVYLSGEIHSDWREVIAQGVAENKLPIRLTSPNTSHEDSDDCGKSKSLVPDHMP